jgi:hypothetical protein
MANNTIHAFTTKYPKLVDRIITDVKIFEAFDPKIYSVPPNPSFSTKALWDTGATNSVITNDTVKHLNLIPTGVVLQTHAGGCNQVNIYLVSIGLPNNVLIVGVPVMECPSTVGNFGAIIGMDIINKGDFAITNVNHQTTLSYRLPSTQTIDYVSELMKLKYNNIGRNDPCPCGLKDVNGKPIKFKNCHGK